MAESEQSFMGDDSAIRDLVGMWQESSRENMPEIYDVLNVSQDSRDWADIYPTTVEIEYVYNAWVIKTHCGDRRRIAVLVPGRLTDTITFMGTPCKASLVEQRQDEPMLIEKQFHDPIITVERSIIDGRLMTTFKCKGKQGSIFFKRVYPN